MTDDEGVRSGRARWAGAAELVGRENEVGLLVDRVERLRDGRGGAVLLEGPAGIGKTRLIEAALEAAAAAGIRYAAAGGDPLGIRRPFQVALAIAAGLAVDEPREAALGELLDSVRQRSDPMALMPPGSARVTVIETIVADLERIAVDPLVLAVEDLHWTDDASLATLRAALTLVDELPLLVIASVRPAEGRPSEVTTRAELARAGSVLRVEELSRRDTVTLVGELVGGRAGPRLADTIERAGGNPFLVTELLRALLATGDLVDRAGMVELCDDAATDAALGDVAAARLGSVDAVAFDLLRPASVLGPVFSVRDVARIADRSAGSFAALTAALASGLIVEDGAELRFTHELARDAVYRAMPESLRAALHEDTTRYLAKQGASPVAIATHAALGAAPTEAVGWLRSAAADVMSLEPSLALSMLDDALALGAPDRSVQVAIQRGRVESLMGVGRLEDAARLGLQLWPEIPAGDARAELLVRLAALLVLLNRTGEAIQILERAADESESPGRRALAQAQGALARMTMIDLEGAALQARDAAALAEASGQASARTIAASVLARLPCFSHGYRDGLPAAMAAIAAADADPTGRAHDYVPWFWVGVIGLDLDDFDLVDRALREGRDRADEGFTAWAHPLYCGLAASAHYRRGSLDAARAEAQTGVSLSVETGSTQARMWCEGLLALTAHLQGETRERDALAVAAEASWERDNAFLGIDHFAVVQSLTWSAEATCEHLSGTWDLFAELGLYNCQPLLALPLVRAAAGRDPNRVEDVVAEIAGAARRTALPGLAALELQIRSIVDESLDGLRAAADGFGGLGRRLDRAEALSDAARIAVRRGHTSAGQLRGAAVAEFEACEAFGAARALERDLGTRRGEEARHRSPEGWDSLTPTEQSVVGLVGKGLTNGEIAARRHVSRRTVESHLLRVYSKLGYSSRTRLAVEANERDEFLR